jgi:outer membrane murein-binding lipoprotein Lpp
MSTETEKELSEAIRELTKDVKRLQSDVRDLTTHVEYLKKDREESKKRFWNVALAFVGALISSLVIFITSGGMNGK